MRDIIRTLVVGEQEQIGSRVVDGVALMIFGGGFVVDAERRGPCLYRYEKILCQ